MAMIQCPECKQSVSSVANACPNCGFAVSKWLQDHEQQRLNAKKPLQRSQFLMVMLAALGASALLCCGIGNCGESSNKEQRSNSAQNQKNTAKTKEEALRVFEEQRGSLAEKITSLGEASQTGEWDRAAALDTEITAALNSVDRFPNVEGRDELRAQSRQARIPLLEYQLQNLITLGRLEDATKVHQELASLTSPKSEELGNTLKLAVAQDHLIKSEAAASGQDWIAALSLAESGLQAVEGLQNKDADVLVKKLERVKKSVEGKAKKAQEAIAKQAAEQAQRNEDCNGKSDCLFIDNRRLWQEYHDNEVAADQRYKGRTLVVSGRVDSIDKDFMDGLVIRLRSSNPYMTTMANLNKKQENVAAQLRKGAEIDMRCTGGGMVIGSPVLRDCWVLRYQR